MINRQDITAMPTPFENSTEGMTLRDYFAAKAMSALLTAEAHYEYQGAFTQRGREPASEDVDEERGSMQMDITIKAYEVADCMLDYRTVKYGG